MSQVTDQIKERISVVDFLSEYLKLDRAGSNYKALCPFHNEKTPSFMVNPERNFWYCFGCQKGGDIFSFIMEMEGLEFREALDRLAERAGVEIPRYTLVNQEAKNQKQRVLDILEAATKYYEFQLYKNPMAKQALDYLYQRKIFPDQLSQFRIGYAPDGWDNILGYLLKRNFKLEDIVSTGLLVQKESATSVKHVQSGQFGNYYDRFRHRIMFPIADVTGNIVGYSARVMPGGDEKNAKYINTPQTMVYDKSQVLYGLFQARSEIKKKNQVIVVEGNLDVIASHSASVGNIVAVSGTALTEQHIKLIRRYTENIKLCFDMDNAGQQATRKSIQSCLKNQMEVEVIILPTGVKDVNDTVINDPQLWKQAIDQALPVMKYYFETARNNHDLRNIKDRKIVAQQLLNIIKNIADPIEQSYWLKKLSALIEIDEEVLTKVLEKATVRKDTASTNIKRSEHKVNSKPRKLVLEQQLLGLFSLFPSQLQNRAIELNDTIFSPEVQSLWQAMKQGQLGEHYRHINEFQIAVKYYYDNKEGFVENKLDPIKEWDLTVREIEKEKYREDIVRLKNDIARAEEQGDDDSIRILLNELNQLLVINKGSEDDVVN